MDQGLPESSRKYVPLPDRPERGKGTLTNTFFFLSEEMVVDSTLQMGVRRNIPIRYDRELVAKTLKAMERISEIRTRRERAFFKRRMVGKRERELAVARKLVAENEHLLPRMRGSEKRRLAEEQAMAVDETEETRTKKTTTVEKRRLVATADGGVAEVTETVTATSIVDDDEGGGFGDDDRDDDDDMGMD